MEANRSPILNDRCLYDKSIVQDNLTRQRRRYLNSIMIVMDGAFIESVSVQSSTLVAVSAKASSNTKQSVV